MSPPDADRPPGRDPAVDPRALGRPLDETKSTSTLIRCTVPPIRCGRCGAEVQPPAPDLADLIPALGELVRPLVEQLEAAAMRVIEQTLDMPDERPATLMALHDPVDIDVEVLGRGRVVGLALSRDGMMMPVVQWSGSEGGWEVLEGHPYRVMSVVSW